MSENKVSLVKEQESAMIPVGSNSPAVESSTIGTIGVVGESVKMSLHDALGKVADPCPKCGHLICVCSLLNLVHGEDNPGL